MTRQRIHLTIDALTVEGGPISRPALTRAIEAALAERLGDGAAPIWPEAQALERVDATARPGPRRAPTEAAIGRAVAGATHKVLKP